MAQIVVRNIPDESIALLKHRASEAGLSTEAFVRGLIEREAAWAAQAVRRRDAVQRLDAIRALSPPSSLSSTSLLREMREADNAGG